jgi:hypothetical protein
VRFIPVPWISCVELEVFVETLVDVEEETDELWEDTEDSSDDVAALIETLELLDDVLSLLPQAARDSISTKVSARTKNLFILKTSRFNKFLRKTII